MPDSGLFMNLKDYFKASAHPKTFFFYSIFGHGVGLHNNAGHVGHLRWFVVILRECFNQSNTLLRGNNIYENQRWKRKAINDIKAVNDAEGKTGENKGKGAGGCVQVSHLLIKISCGQAEDKQMQTECLCVRNSYTQKHTQPDVKATEQINFSWQAEGRLVDAAGKVSGLHEFDPHSVSKQHTGALLFQSHFSFSLCVYFFHHR